MQEKRSVDGLQFISTEFDMLLGLYAVKDDNVASFHQASNGAVGEVNVNPLQNSCLENPMDRRAWQATVYVVTRVRHD